MNTDREQMIQDYINGYNQFDIDKMIAGFDDTVVFENIQNGEVNMSIAGIAAFRQQAEQAKDYFTTRQQTIKSYHHRSDETEIEIDYMAVLAMDLPNGLKKGATLHLSGRSVFRFLGNKIIKLTDIS
jgi:hypothetical protein